MNSCRAVAAFAKPVSRSRSPALLEFVFPAAGLILDPLEAPLLARLVGFADALLALLESGGGGFLGRREGCIGFRDGGGQLAGVLRGGAFTFAAFLVGAGGELLIQLLRPGGNIPHRGSEALDQFERLAGSRDVTHSPS